MPCGILLLDLAWLHLLLPIVEEPECELQVALLKHSLARVGEEELLLERVRQDLLIDLIIRMIERVHLLERFELLQSSQFLFFCP